MKTDFNLVLKSHHSPIHPVTEFIKHLEYATPGSIHLHMFVYNLNAPQYEDIAAYYDEIISCSKNVPSEHQKYIKDQRHHHTRKGCQIGNSKNATLDFQFHQCEKLHFLNQWNSRMKMSIKNIKLYGGISNNTLDGYGMQKDVTQSFDEMLHDLNITYDDYIKAVYSSVAWAKVFLK